MLLFWFGLDLAVSVSALDDNYLIYIFAWSKFIANILKDFSMQMKSGDPSK